MLHKMHSKMHSKMRSKVLHKVLRKEISIATLFVFILSLNCVFAQNEDDALRFSNTFGAYSNRAIGMGG